MKHTLDSYRYFEVYLVFFSFDGNNTYRSKYCILLSLAVCPVVDSYRYFEVSSVFPSFNGKNTYESKYCILLSLSVCLLTDS